MPLNSAVTTVLSHEQLSMLMDANVRTRRGGSLILFLLDAFLESWSAFFRVFFFYFFK